MLLASAGKGSSSSWHRVLTAFHYSHLLQFVSWCVLTRLGLLIVLDKGILGVAATCREHACGIPAYTSPALLCERPPTSL